MRAIATARSMHTMQLHLRRQWQSCNSCPSKPVTSTAANFRRASRHQPAPCASTAPVAAVGIDLGTTSSAIALVASDGRPHIVHDAGGPAVIPSVVHITQNGSTLVGRAAVDAGASDASSTFYSVKRLIGRSFSQVQGLLPGLTYKVVEGPSGSTLLACSNQPAAGEAEAAQAAAATSAPHQQPPSPGSAALLQPEQVSALVLRHLLHRAEVHMSGQAGSTEQRRAAVREAVITVPAYFTPEQRRATVRAAQLAGLQRATLLQEPVAAAMAYGFGKPTDWDTILVFDLGGGTLDLSLLESFEGIMEVVATGGDARLGGDDFTDAAVSALASALPEDLRKRVREGSVSPAFRLALRRAAEAAKERLSSHDEVQVQLPADPSSTCIAPEALPTNPGDSSTGAASSGSGSESGASIDAPGAGAGAGVLGQGSQQGAMVSVCLTRAQLDEACRELVVRLWAPLEALVKDTRTQLGGSPPDLLPEWQQQQQQRQGSAGEASASTSGGTSAKGDSSGAGQGARQGAGQGAAPGKLWGREFEVFASAAGGTTAGAAKYAAPPRRLTGIVLVGAATRMPGVRRFIQHVTGLEPAAGVDPEAVVALGAATYAGILQGSSSGVELTDSAYVAELHNRASALLSDWQA